MELTLDNTVDRSVRHRWLLTVVVILHAVIGLPYLFAGLLAPTYGVALLWALWIAGAGLIWQFRDRPGRAIWVPVSAMVAWVAVVTVGDLLLGWTA